MPKILVEPLYRRALSTVSKSIWKFIKDHGNSCENCETQHKVESCHSSKSVKEWLTLPHNISQEIFNRVELLWDYHGFLDHIENQNSLRHLLIWLFHTPELKIESFVFSRIEDTLLVVKFGRNIDMLCVYDCESVFQSEQLWKTVLFCATNIHVLNLMTVKLTDSILETVGVECSQLRVLADLELNDYVSVKVFEKLCFRKRKNEVVRNHCCSTLQWLQVRKYSGSGSKEFREKALQVKMNQFVPFLLKNLVTLKSLGRHFDVTKYLETVNPHEILETGLEYVYASRITSLMKKFCPRVRELHLRTLTTMTNINDLLCFSLETLTISGTACRNQANCNFLFSRVFSHEWKFLKKLNCTYIVGTTLKLTTLARNLPCLEELIYNNFDEVEWNGMTCFRYLKVVSFEMEKVLNISWALSFAETVVDFSFSWKNSEDVSDSRKRDACSVFTTVHFLGLEMIHVEKFAYDFDFMKKLIQHCPMLKCMALTVNDEERTELSQFLVENRFELDID